MTENTPGDSSDDGLNRPPLAGKRIVRINDAQAPFRFIALYALDAIPRKGDAILIRLNESQPPSLYRVETVAHNPFDPQAQVNIGVLYFDPQSGPAQPGQMTEAAARERMDQIVKSQLQLLEKAQAYTNVIIVAGYAGSLALWNFAKPNMTSRGVNWTVLLIGLSLVAFVTWEVVVMIYRATAMSAFGKSVREKPTDFFDSSMNIALGNRDVLPAIIRFGRSPSRPRSSPGSRERS